MASFHYGIDCEDEKKAKKLWQFIARLEIAQDGLDWTDERVSVVAGQALLTELESHARANTGDLRVEVWPAGMEYDDAEASADLEVHAFKGKPGRAIASGPARFKAYAGSEANHQAFQAWLQDGRLQGLEILDQWTPQVQGGSWGVEFRCDAQAFDKAVSQEWLARGVVVEKLRR